MELATDVQFIPRTSLRSFQTSEHIVVRDASGEVRLWVHEELSVCDAIGCSMLFKVVPGQGFEV